MQIEWVRFDRERYNPHALAAVRQGAREGTLLDVATDQIFIALLLRNLRAIPRRRGRRTGPAAGIQADQPASPTGRSGSRNASAPSRPSSPTARRWSTNDYVVKIYRKLEAGINPEIEMGRFLTDVAGFANTPALLGSVELVEGDKRSAIGIVHAFVANQGDAWTVTAAYLDRFVDEQRLLAATEHPGESEEQVPYLRYMSQTGRRVAEMHVALASNSETSRIRAGADAAGGRAALDRRYPAPRRTRVRHAQATARRAEGSRPAAGRPVAGACRRACRIGSNALLPREIDGLNIRHHGDFHLGQMLIVKDDIFIIDFEGEPRRTIAERRRKAPAARDVAGLIRSIDYSATAALERALKVAPDEQGRLAAALAEWRDRATARVPRQPIARPRPTSGFGRPIRSRRPDPELLPA